MKIRYLDGRHLDWPDRYTCKITRLNDIYKGCASLIDIETVKRKVCFAGDCDQIVYGDSGYRWLIFLPEDDNWCMTAVYDNKHMIVEWYFDITRRNFLDCEVPYYEDLYLDVVLSPNSGIKILDEDELLEALEKGIITGSEFDMAHSVCRRLVRDIGEDGLISSFCDRCIAALSADADAL